MRAHVHLYSTALVRGVLALRSAMTEYVSAYNAVGQKTDIRHKASLRYFTAPLRRPGQCQAGSSI
jgi:hypothetical protein